MATALARQQEQFRTNFQKEIAVALKSKQKQGQKQDSTRVKRMQRLAEEMADSIGRRRDQYVQAFVPDAMTSEVDARLASATPDARERLESLEAKLQQRIAEADQLRAQILEREKAEMEESLRQCNVDVLEARQAALSNVEVVGQAAMKGEQLQQQMQQIEMLVSATDSLTSDFEQEREHNRRIEEQRRRPLHYMEAEMLAPVGTGAFGSGAVSAMVEEDEASERMSTDLERSQKICKRMQRQFDDFA